MKVDLVKGELGMNFTQPEYGLVSIGFKREEGAVDYFVSEHTENDGILYKEYLDKDGQIEVHDEKLFTSEMGDYDYVKFWTIHKRPVQAERNGEDVSIPFDTDIPMA